jgi:hypothetical protein
MNLAAPLHGETRRPRSTLFVTAITTTSSTSRPSHAVQPSLPLNPRNTRVTPPLLALARHRPMFMDGAGQRESAYRTFAGCPSLVMNLQIDVVLGCSRGDYRIRRVSRCVCFLKKASCFVLKRRSKGSPRCGARCCGVFVGRGLQTT